MVNNIGLLAIGHTLESYRAVCNPPPDKTCYDWLGGLTGCQEKPLRYKYAYFENRNVGTGQSPDYWLDVPGKNMTAVYIEFKKPFPSFWVRCKCNITIDRSFCNIQFNTYKYWDLFSIRDENHNVLLKLEAKGKTGLGFDNIIEEIRLIADNKSEVINFPIDSDFIFDLRFESNNVQLFINDTYITLQNTYAFNRLGKYFYVGDENRHVWNHLQVKWIIVSEQKAENCEVKTIWPEDTGALKDWTWDESHETPNFWDLREKSWVIRADDYMGAYDYAAQTFKFRPPKHGQIVGSQINGLFFGLVPTTKVYYIRSNAETIYDLSEGFSGEFGETFKTITYQTDEPITLTSNDEYGVIMEMEE